MNHLAKFIPINRQEHENELRTIIGKHMGNQSGNPTQWVVDAVAEAYQRGFGIGFAAGSMPRVPAPPPAFMVQIPPDQQAPTRTKALPFVERIVGEDDKP